MPQVATIPMGIERRAAGALISELAQEVALWKRRAETAERRLVQLDQENAQLRAKVAELDKTIAALRKELAEAKRSAGRFRRNKRKQPRNKPGRKKGQGRFSHLQEAPASPDTTQVDVPAPETCDCGGSLEFLRYEEASNTDPPKDVHPHVTKYRVPVCRCQRCGVTVRGKHADLAPDQYGATAHRYGDRMMAAGHLLHYGMGIPQRAVPAVIEMLTRVKLTQSALNQDAIRRCKAELNLHYKALRDSMKDQAVGHTDATGWRVDGEAAQMIVYANSDVTVYDIREHYRNDEIREVFPSDYKGTLVGDGAKAFDAKKLSRVSQQKCIFHGLKLIREASERQDGKAGAFRQRLKGMLQEGLALWHGYHDGKKRGYRAKVANLDQRLEKHLRARRLNNGDNQKLLKFFRTHHRKGNLTRFLHDPSVPPTNNLAELELRFLIPARKVSQCSKNGRGAHAQKVLASIIRTEKRKMVKEQMASQKPYADQRSFQAEQRQGGKLKVLDAPSELRTSQGRPAGTQVVQPGAVAHPVELLDRVTDIFRSAKQTLRTIKEVAAQVLCPPRSRSP